MPTNMPLPFFGGVPSQILYDNLKTAVKRVLVGRQREEQNAFLKFRAHHGFESLFCNVAKGNEKGIVEGLVRHVKNHIFTPIPEFTSIEALNEWLEECCRKLNNRPRGKQKISFQDRFNRFNLITLDKNHYSVPVDYVGRLLTVKGYIHEIRT